MNSERSDPGLVLALNAGSSSLKFGVFRAAERPERLLGGDEEGAASDPAVLKRALARASQAAAGQPWAGIGHRIVHGGPALVQPRILDGEVRSELRRLIPFAPEHLPGELDVIERTAELFPDTRQVGCFDTAFHAGLPPVARVLPIPRRFEDEGIRRYGFHGLSYEYLLDELRRIGDPAAARGRVVLAHLGNGASMAAIRDGSCVDTSMGFTPAGGLVMGTRCGDLDPGLLAYLAKAGGLSPESLSRLVSHESGLLGLSGSTADMRTLLAAERSDPKAALAVEIFCMQARKWVGAFAAVLGGLDTLVFSGGIGEHNAEVRRRICDGLGFLGIQLNNARNSAGAPIISSGPVTVRVIATDEEFVIARSVGRVLGLFPARGPRHHEHQPARA